MLHKPSGEYVAVKVGLFYNLFYILHETKAISSSHLLVSLFVHLFGPQFLVQAQFWLFTLFLGFTLLLARLYLFGLNDWLCFCFSSFLFSFNSKWELAITQMTRVLFQETWMYYSSVQILKFQLSSVMDI